MRKKILLFAFLAILGGYLWLVERQPPSKSPQQVNDQVDSVLNDTLILNHSKLERDTSSGPDPINKITSYFGKLTRCCQLADSAEHFLLLYTQGKISHASYMHAHKVYETYYFNVYKPAYDSLGK